MKCPKMVLQSHACNPLILQAKHRTNIVAEKANFTGHIYNREKLHVLRSYPFFSRLLERCDYPTKHNKRRAKHLRAAQFFFQYQKGKQ